MKLLHKFNLMIISLKIIIIPCQCQNRNYLFFHFAIQILPEVNKIWMMLALFIVIELISPKIVEHPLKLNSKESMNLNPNQKCVFLPSIANVNLNCNNHK